MLNVEQKIELSHLEKTIERGKHACIEMALALLKIREERLYRENHPTFEAYCQTRWEFSDRYGRMLVEYGETIREMQAIGTIVPGNEAQSRALKGLETEQKAEALTGAATVAPNGKPTAQHVQRATAAVKSKPETPFQPGIVATVLDESSPHYGQTVEVVQTEGVIVQAKTQSGETVPFLSNELGTGETARPSAEKVWAQKPKPNPLETVEIQLDIANQRIAILEVKLKEAIDLLNQYPHDNRKQSWINEVNQLLA